MNERIKELAGQALDKVVPYTWTTLNYDEIQKLQQYFAELIIRDVTETAAKYRQSKTRPVGWNFTATVLDQYGLKEQE